MFTYRYEILQQHAQPLSKDDQMIKIDTRSKFKMAAAAILKITFLAITRPLLHAFAPNLNLDWKWCPTVRFTAKIHIMKKSKMAAAAILKKS